MTYQVLARGWRPQRFDDVVGQGAVVTTLKNALAAGTLGQAYLFSGLRGVGKTTAARLLAKAVNCERGPTPEPCGECASCTEIAAGASLDVVELDAATHTGVDQVRELQEFLRFGPTRDRFRVIIFDEVHMLSKSSFNALLKSVEEPPPYVLWILATTERDKVPATILSRCQQLEFRAVSTELITDRLVAVATGEGFRLTREAADAVARAAQGSVRDALTLLDQLRAFAADEVDEAAVAEVLGLPPFERVAALVGAMADGDAAAGLGSLRDELAAGHDPVVVFNEVGRLLRLATHLALAPELELGLTANHREQVARLATSLGAGPLSRMLGLWVDHEGLVRAAGNRDLALEVACLRLARWPAVQRVESFLAGGTPPPAATSGGGQRRAGGGSPGPVRTSASAARPLAPATSVPAAPLDPTAAVDATDPKGALVAQLWEEREHELAGAVDSATVRVEDGLLVLSFAAGQRALAELVNAAASRRRLEAAWQHLELPVSGLRLEVAEDSSSLLATAAADPAVVLVKRIIGGDLVAAWPDDGPVS